MKLESEDSRLHLYITDQGLHKEQRVICRVNDDKATLHAFISMLVTLPAGNNVVSQARP